MCPISGILQKSDWSGGPRAGLPLHDLHWSFQSIPQRRPGICSSKGTADNSRVTLIRGITMSNSIN